MFSRMTLVCSFLLSFAVFAAVSGEGLPQKVDPWVIEKSATGQADFLVMLREQGDLRGARALSSKTEKAAFVMDVLQSTAERSQKPLLDLLAERGAAHRSYWVANMIWVRGGRSLVEELAAREDVFHIYANPKVPFDGPVASRPSPSAPDVPDTIEWGVAKVHAPDVWALGYTGQGIVVGGQDTGYDWEHPAIKGKYRGWTGFFADHNYNWHDAIHSGGGSCGADSPEPCDDNSHGTHTMGTMVGDDGGGNQIGVAPGAQWIGCRNMDQGNGTPETYSECFQWFIAPTDLQDQNPNPAKAPHVINNSWGCPPSEGCTDPTVLQTVVENTRAAGIEVVVSAGNAGSSCSTVEDPPAIYDASFSIGATDIGDGIAGFSSRGPVTIDGSGRLKPDVSAPGVNVRSSVPGGGYAVFSGTSMAGPHVVGIVALVLSANADLVGEPDAIEPLLSSSAVPRTTSQTCSGVPGSQIPNNTYGWGRADALAAVASCPFAAPTITAPVSVPAATGGLTATANSQAGHTDTWTLTGGLITAGQGTSTVTFQSGGAGTTMLLELVDSLGACEVPAEAVTISVDFSDVPPSHLFHDYVNTVLRNGITSGCGSGNYCPGASVTRAQMAVFLLKALLGSAYVPPVVAQIFTDVPPGSFASDWINDLFNRGVTGGCGGNNYCPGNPVTRAQAAVFLLKTLLGSAYVPPVVAQIFADVPPGSFAFDWINDLFNRGVTAGCGSGNYCPDSPNTRGHMAVLLVRTFDLQ